MNLFSLISELQQTEKEEKSVMEFDIVSLLVCFSSRVNIRESSIQ